MRVGREHLHQGADNGNRRLGRSGGLANTPDPLEITFCDQYACATGGTAENLCPP